MNTSKSSGSKLASLDSLLQPDPRNTLEIMQSSEWKNNIYNIGHTPFFVHFWTAYQIRLWRHHVKLFGGSASMDATGSIIKRISLPNGKKSKAILLYLITVGDECGQYIVAAMISESHNTVQIANFLGE